MCLACEQDAIWLAYLESRGLLKPDDPAAVEALFAGFPVQPLPEQPLPQQFGEAAESVATAKPAVEAANNPFACDDPTADLPALKVRQSSGS